MVDLSAFINHVLGQHPQARDRLRAHAGKTVRIDARPIFLVLGVTDTGEVQAASLAGDADVSFRISATQIPLMLADPEGALKKVHLTGDAQFAQVIAGLLRDVRWDAEEDLSRVIGDVPAYRAMQAARTFAAWGRDASQRLSGSAAAYLVDQQPLLVHREMAEEFAAGTVQARDACARLEKRIELLETRRRATPSR